MKKIIVDKNVCIGCGFCAANVEKVFLMDDDDLALAKNNILDNMSEEEKEEVLDVKEGCPVGAILIIEEEF